MSKGMLVKFRARLGAGEMRKQKPAKLGKTATEEEKLEAAEEKLERVTDEVMQEIDKIEELKEETQKKRHEFSWIKGKITGLLLQDFVGASFGAMFFVFTQEVWDITPKLNALSVSAIIILSLVSGFSLIYSSRRRKMVSVKVYHTALLRGIEIYIISFLTALMFILILGVFAYEPWILFKGSVIIALPAVISAATADLLFY